MKTQKLLKKKDKKWNELLWNLLGGTVVAIDLNFCHSIRIVMLKKRLRGRVVKKAATRQSSSIWVPSINLKIFFLIILFTLKQSRIKKVKQKFGLEFWLSRPTGCKRVRYVERKLIFAYWRLYPKNILKMELFKILSERPKMYIFVHVGTKGLTNAL